ncbi:DeoR/GlpR family DNA-binding transcription regulator [Agilicoccus flavus]|uniref:DeoR/GlpR family DNA-binding transcription regulator n=1 Tax=Agilicoccus flavus TaxID=2775968 RepID=UPI001CF62737|nr:DeoR/GlpR family DNA-binding transcription regulator [Agilicoccus flavus]
MLREQRHHLILDALRARGTSTVADLAGSVDASVATLRRDLAELDASGLLRRVRGGAMPIDEHDEPFDAVRGVNADAKEAIARVAAGLVRDGQSVLLDIGTTTHRIAQALCGRRITVLTSSLPAAAVLAGDPAVELMVLGGLVRRDYHSMVGFLTEHALEQVHADVLFLSTSGIRTGGDGDLQVMDTTVLEVPIKRAMLRAASRAYVVADATKFPGRGSSRVCDGSDLAGLVTSATAPAAALDAARRGGLEVHLDDVQGSRATETLSNMIVPE